MDGGLITNLNIVLLQEFPLEGCIFGTQFLGITMSASTHRFTITNTTGLVHTRTPFGKQTLLKGMF